MSYGQASAALIEAHFNGGAERAVALLRHSAREYVDGRHDLDNPLTAEGRAFARSLGEWLPKTLTLRAYASPPERCMETAELVLAGHQAGGGQVTRHRALEALGVFYALDQTRMWMSMRSAGGLAPFVARWLEGAVPADAVMQPREAAGFLLRVLRGRLLEPGAAPQLDVCVTHDMTLHLLRGVLFDEAPEERPVPYLDGLLFFEAEGDLRVASPCGKETLVSVA